MDEGGGFTELTGATTGPFFVSLLGTATSALPVDVEESVVEDSDGFFVVGAGRLVRDPLAALEITLENLMTVRFDVRAMRSGGADFRCVAVPVPTLTGMMPLEMFDVCIPVDPNGDAIVTFADDPTARFVRLRFGAALGPAPAPALGRIGLIGALLALLAAGASAMRRSRRFAAALPALD